MQAYEYADEWNLITTMEGNIFNYILFVNYTKLHTSGLQDFD